MKLCVIILLLLIPKSDAEVTCTAGAFPSGTKASVVCDFNQDLNLTRQNFNIVQHVSKDATDSGNYVLLCNWGTTLLECNTKDGYSFNKNVSKQVTLDIPQMSALQQGVYVCQIVPGTSSVTPNTCELTIGESSTITTTQPTVPCPTCPPAAGLAPTTLPCVSGTWDIARLEKNDSGSGPANVALIICLVIFILLFLAVMVVLRYVRKSFHFSRKNDYCPWIPNFWTLKEVRRDEEMPPTHTAAAGSRTEHSAVDVRPSGSQPGASAERELLIPEGTPSPTRAASTNDEYVTLTVAKSSFGEADTGATTKADEHQSGESATNSETEDTTKAEGKPKHYIEDEVPGNTPLQFLSALMKPERGDES